MNILSIGFDIPGYGDDYIDYKIPCSFHDGELIFFCPTFHYDYSTESYQGKTKYSESGSYKIQKDTEHWKDEIVSAITSGQTVVIILPEFTEFVVYTGKNELKGTGRSATTINYVTEYNNYKSIADTKLKFKSTHGTKLKCVDPNFQEFYNQFEELLTYKTYIDCDLIKPAFTTLTGEKILGGTIKVGKGHLILLPYFDFEQKGYTRTTKGNTVWTPKAIEKGKIFVNLICKIEKSLKSEIEKSPPPEWVNHSEYSLKSEVTILKEINDNIEKIDLLNSKNLNLEKQLNQETVLKDLLYSNGKQLEVAVIRALNLLGYEAANYDDGTLELDQVITSPEGERFIGECEGKDSRDIDITKFRQLVDSLNEDFSKDEVEERAIGILFGNPQRLIAPNERTLDFTLKCKNAAAREKVALIRTADLFIVAKYLQEKKNEAFKIACRKSIKKHLGGIVQFPNPPHVK